MEADPSKHDAMIVKTVKQLCLTITDLKDGMSAVLLVCI